MFFRFENIDALYLFLLIPVLIVIFIIILPTFGAGCMALYKAETSSASQGKLHPRVKETAKRLLGIYLGLVFLEIIPIRVIPLTSPSTVIASATNFK